MSVVGEDMKSCGVDKNMIRDREWWRERIRVVDPICVGRRQRKRRKLILKTDFFPGLLNIQTVRSLYM